MDPQWFVVAVALLPGVILADLRGGVRGFLVQEQFSRKRLQMRSVLSVACFVSIDPCCHCRVRREVLGRFSC